MSAAPAASTASAGSAARRIERDGRRIRWLLQRINT
jgi:hypothetical protein